MRGILVAVIFSTAACQPPVTSSGTREIGPPLYSTRQLLISGMVMPPETRRAGAFGIVAFTNEATNATRPRFAAVCQAYVATLSSQAEADRAGISTAHRMITFWPVTGADATEAWMGDCPRMVDNYSVLEARRAVKLAEVSPVARTEGLRPGVWTRRGPFLLAWSPPVSPASERLYIFMDLSDFDMDEDLLTAFRTYRDRIENNPKIWGDDNRFNLIAARVQLRNFLNRYGEDVVAFFRGG
jgi:hypothetical protein